MQVNEIWTERYRPAKYKAVLLPKAYRDYFDEMLSKGECYNILLHSSVPGTGKTCLAQTIIRELGAESRYINASLDRGIDVLREEIRNFAMTQSIVGKGKKIVFLDEFDGATPVLQDSLKGFVEQYVSNCRFIITCNKIEKIVPALREGRFNVFDFNFSKPELRTEMTGLMKGRLANILRAEKIEFEEAALDFVVKSCYPSMREMIAVVGKTAKMYGKVYMDVVETPETVRRKLYELIEKKVFKPVREYVVSESLDVSALYSYLYEEWVPTLPEEKQLAVIPVLADFQYQHNAVSDTELNFAACVVRLQEVL